MRGASRLVYLVAGEASGDMIGARLMRSLARVAAPSPVRFAGVGGEQMCSHGLSSLYPMSDLSVMGLLELVPHLPRLAWRLSQTADDIAHRRPDCVVCIDSKGFNARLMRAVRARLGAATPPLVQYVAPSAWAYRDGLRGARRFAELADQLLLLLPFEAEYWRAAGVQNTSVVGHPAVEAFLEAGGSRGVDASERALARASLGLAPDATVLALLPGSRPAEAARSMELLPRTLGALRKSGHRFQALFVAPPTTDALVRARVRELGVPSDDARVVVTTNAAPHALRAALGASDVAVCASGTAALECALHARPTVAFYRASALTELAARALARVHHVSIPNLLLELDGVPPERDPPEPAAGGERAPLPEVLFSRCTPARLADTVAPLAFDVRGPGSARAARAAQLCALAPVCEALVADSTSDGQMPSERAANIVWRMMMRAG